MIDHIKKEATLLKKQIIDIRRHIHRHPELSYEEHQTAAYISSVLSDWGIEHQTGIADTGILGHIRGVNPDKAMVMLRADIDALPIQELNDCDYKSENDGCMHACGHDVHTSSLLGTLRILQGMKDEFEGTIRFIFQPGEERLPGGATLMIKEGVLENPKPDLVIGQHVFPEMQVGRCGFKAGMYMASADEITMKVIGEGGHAAMPDKNADTVLAAAQIITELQTVVSRSAPPAIPTVLSFGHIEGGHVFNVIPKEVLIRGTFRTFDEEWRLKAHDKIRQIAGSIAAMNDLSCEILIDKGYPFVFNHKKPTLASMRYAKEFMGKGEVEELQLRMTAEDFAYYSHEVPAVFYRLGTSNDAKGIGGRLHNPNFNVDEDALEYGMGLMAHLALSHLKDLTAQK